MLRQAVNLRVVFEINCVNISSRLIKILLNGFLISLDSRRAGGAEYFAHFLPAKLRFARAKS